MKVTVIIPMFNAEDTIEQAIKSIPNRKDIEIIVIDDGSEDNSYLIAQKALKGRKSKLIHKENGGVSSALNVGLEKASGEYMVLLGADDDFYADEFEKAVEQLDGTDLVYFNLKINDGTVWEVNEKSKFALCGSVKFMRRDFIGNQKNNESVKYAEDWLFYQELIKKNPTEKFTNLTVKHYNYPREGSLSWQQREKNRDKLSIIIPHYNTGTQLRKLVLKLQKQVKDYPETEVIIIDDGSTEDVKWLKSTGFRVFFQRNKGVSAARNRGLDNATGRYISFIDSDDDIEDDYIHTIYQIMRRSQCDYSIYRFFAGNRVSNNRDELLGNHAVWSYSFTANCIGNERFNESMKVFEDYDWLRRVVTPEKKRFECEKPIYHYLWESNKDSLSKRKLRGEL